MREVTMAIEQFTKVCTKCGEIKPLSSFHRMGEKHRPRCKPCHIQDSTKWANENKERYLSRLREWYDKNKRSHRIPQTKEEKLEKKRASNKAWREKNKERVVAIRKSWADRNKHVEMERVRRRQATKKKATPKWANKDAMAIFYLDAVSKTSQSGMKWTVDHIVPLTSDIVCGLHCEANLQVMEFTENVRKGNRWWPNMP